MLSEGVTVEAIGRADERAWKSPYRDPAEQPATQVSNPSWLSTSSEDAKRRLVSDDPTRTQYVKKVVTPPDVFEDAADPPASLDQLMADIGAEMDEDGEAKRKEA